MIMDLPPQKKETMRATGENLPKQQQLWGSWVFPETEKILDPDSHLRWYPSMCKSSLKAFTTSLVYPSKQAQ